VNKNYSCDILIYNLQKDIFEAFNSHPPWKVMPCRIIKAAHFDSILDIEYLSYSQILVTSSMDGTIKFWDPTAHEYNLTAHNYPLRKIKKGYYIKPEIETTKKNMPFAEIDRIYTGKMKCY